MAPTAVYFFKALRFGVQINGFCAQKIEDETTQEFWWFRVSPSANKKSRPLSHNLAQRLSGKLIFRFLLAKPHGIKTKAWAY